MAEKVLLCKDLYHYETIVEIYYAKFMLQYI